MKDLITIAVHTRERAAIIQARLKDDGIDCMLTATDTHFAPGFAGQRIMVAQKDVQKAMEIISALHFEYGEDEPVLEHQSERIMTIAVSSWQKAELMHEMLASAGIQSALINMNILQAGISGGVKLRIHEQDVDAAMKIIKGVQGEKQDDADYEWQFGEIMVPVDFSDSSYTACKLAASIAARTGSDIRLFHAYYNPVIGAMPFDEASYSFHDSVTDLFNDSDESLRKRIELLNAQLEDLIDKAGSNIKVSNTIVRGIASDSIIEYASILDVGLIIISRGLHEDRTGLFMGNISGKVVEQSPVPVLVIPNEYESHQLDDYKHIAYATNFEECDIRVMERLHALTRSFCDKVTCVHISGPGESKLDQARIETMKQKLNDRIDFEIETAVLEDSNVLEGFNKIINDAGIKVLAVTTRQRNFISRIFYPSLTRRVMLHMDLPLLVFHA